MTFDQMELQIKLPCKHLAALGTTPLPPPFVYLLDVPSQAPSHPALLSSSKPGLADLARQEEVR